MLASGHGVACVLGWLWMEVIVGGNRGLIRGGGDDSNQRFLKAAHFIIRCNKSQQLAKQHPLRRSSLLQFINNFFSKQPIFHHSLRQIAAAGESASATAIFTVTIDQRFLRGIHLSSFTIAIHILALPQPSLHSDSMFFLNQYSACFFMDISVVI